MYVKLVRVTTRPSLVILIQFVLLSWPIFGKVNMILGQTTFRSMGLKPTYAKEDLIPTLTAVNVAYTSFKHLGLFFFITPAFVCCSISQLYSATSKNALSHLCCTRWYNIQHIKKIAISRHEASAIPKEYTSHNESSI